METNTTDTRGRVHDTHTHTLSLSLSHTHTPERDMETNTTDAQGRVHDTHTHTLSLSLSLTHTSEGHGDQHHRRPRPRARPCAAQDEKVENERYAQGFKNKNIDARHSL